MSCWKIQRACCSARRPIGLCPRVYCRKTAKVSGKASGRLQRQAAAQACELGKLASQMSHIEEVPALGIFHGDGKVSGGQENLQEHTMLKRALQAPARRLVPSLQPFPTSLMVMMRGCRSLL